MRLLQASRSIDLPGGTFILLRVFYGNERVIQLRYATGKRVAEIDVPLESARAIAAELSLMAAEYGEPLRRGS